MHLALELLGGSEHLRRERDRVRLVLKLGHLVKVEIAVCVSGVCVDLVVVLKVLLGRGKAPEESSHGGELCRGEVDVRALAEAVGEVACGGGDHSGLVIHPGLVAHAQRAAGHLRARPHLAEGRVKALSSELLSVHFGRGRYPQLGGQLAFLRCEELARSAEVANVGHARPDEDLVDLVPRNLGQEASVIGIVGRAKDGLGEIVHVDVDDGGVLGLLVCLHEHRLVQPLLHAADASLQRAPVPVALRDHPLEHGHVGVEVLNHRLLVELDCAARRGALRGRVGELKGLLALEVLEALDLEDASREDVLLALLLHSEEALLDGHIGDGVHEVAQGHAGLHGAREAHKHRLRHVQGHEARGGREGDEARAGGEGDTDGEARVGVPSRAHSVRHEHAVEPRVDDAVAGSQAHAAAVHDEVGERVVRDHVHGLGVGGGVAEGLHGEVREEA
mmetsp:Transcript_16984/g.45786  ORF Transcript_16984/g.45786 Transcript_16984/m.45786 type:complete len:447 (-) Transcript_16984:1403-2743(-)